jgi:hypothetical protein
MRRRRVLFFLYGIVPLGKNGKGCSIMFPAVLGFFFSLISLLVTVFTLLVLPSLLCMALWNAVVFKLFHGVSITLFQGVLLWFMVILTVMIVFKPQIKVSVKRLDARDLRFKGLDKDDKNKSSSKTPPSAHWLKWREAQKKEDPKDPPPSSLH